MLLHSIQMKNFLSYGPDAEPIDLRALNIIVGANGSGKSNLLEGVALLRSTPGELVRPVRLGGSVREWLWKGSKETPVATIEAIVTEKKLPHLRMPLRYSFSFTETNSRFEIVDEKLEYERPYSDKTEPFFFYHYEHGAPVLNANVKLGEKKKRALRREDINPEKSILAQRYDPDSYAEISYLADVFKTILVYRDWTFGPTSIVRKPQAVEFHGNFLLEDSSNLGLVLSQLKRTPEAKTRMLEFFRGIYENADDFDVIVEGATIQVYVQEGAQIIPASRLSDGTLRYLCLLAILCHPNPPPLICIDEPELGLHPDMINNIAKALRYASERTQLLVTTHSIGLVDAFTNDPEVIVVCEKGKDGTRLKRLKEEDLVSLREGERLGALWTSGEIGGNRW